MTNLSQEFDAYFETIYDSSYRYALFLTQDTKASEDIVQDVFTKIWQRWERLRHEPNLRGYIKTMIKHRSFNHLRHVRIADRYLQSQVEPVSEEHFEEDLAWVERLLAQLPEKRRQVLQLYIWEEKSYQEISATCGISINTVKDHLKKAYAFLRLKVGASSEDLFCLFLVFKKYKKND